MTAIIHFIVLLHINRDQKMQINTKKSSQNDMFCITESVQFAKIAGNQSIINIFDEADIFYNEANNFGI